MSLSKAVGQLRSHSLQPRGAMPAVLAGSMCALTAPAASMIKQVLVLTAGTPFLDTTPLTPLTSHAWAMKQRMVVRRIGTQVIPPKVDGLQVVPNVGQKRMHALQSLVLLKMKFQSSEKLG